MNKSTRGYIFTEEEMEKREKRISHRKIPYRQNMIILKTFRKLLKRDKDENKEKILDKKISKLIKSNKSELGKLIKSINNNNKDDKLEELIKSVNKIGGLLKKSYITENLSKLEKLLSKVSHIEETNGKTFDKFSEEDEESFIPDIDTNGMDFSGSTKVSETKNSDNNAEEISDALSRIKIRGKKGEEYEKDRKIFGRKKGQTE